jgi:class 3 adenylate cyclase
VDSITLRRQLDCRSAPRALWATLADVESLQRALGQVPLPYKPLFGEGEVAAGFEFFSERAGALRFFELPAEWRSGESLTLSRQFPSGPIAMLKTGFTLTPIGQSTRLELTLSLTPRRPLYRPLLRIYGELSLRHLTRTLARLDEALFRGENPTRRATPLDEAATTRLATKIAADLGEDERPIWDKLLGHLRSVDDLDATRLLPFALADGWELPREKLLAVCLTATAHGLLELRWDVMCDKCRLPARRLQHLEQLHQHFTCSRCAVEIAVHVESSLETSFALSAKLKPAAPRGILLEKTAYARSSPRRTPHVITQLSLPATGRTTLQVPTEPGDYQLFVRGGPTGRLNVSTLGPQTAQLLVDSELRPPVVEVAMGGSLEIAHEHTQAQPLRLMRTEWQRDGVPAHTTLLQPRFRRHFGPDSPSPQRLPPDLMLPVSTVTLWQSELIGGIELCQLLGEPAAHQLMQEYLELLCEVIAREQGALLRSERDGLTAAFSDDIHAARVALLAQQAFLAFRQGHQKAAPALGLRIGLFAGPCHVCTLAGVLEYFGSTQFVCLRLLREAHAGDIMLAADLGEKLQNAMTTGAQNHPQFKLGPRFALSVRGLDAPLPVARLRLE